MPLVRGQQIVEQMATERLAAFRRDLPNKSSMELYTQYIMHKDLCALTDEGREKVAALFKREWGIPESSLRIVGSSALGFSLKPKRLWQFFDDELSDIDVAIVDGDFFADMWQDVHDFVREAGFWQDQLKFQSYLYDGWIRPDVMPGDLGNAWFDFFHGIRKQAVFGRTKVRAALYPRDYFLEHYQCGSIDKCRGGLA